MEVVKGIETMATKSKKEEDFEKEFEKNFEHYIKSKFEGWEKKKKKSSASSHSSGGALYFVGFIGALVYWMQAAVGFGAVVTGFLKALVWPAYIVYKFLENFYGIVV